MHYGASATLAQRFLSGVARRLGLAPEFVFAAYEDAFYYMWKERRLPANVDPFDSKLEDTQERARLARLFEQGLDAATGYILPVARTADDSRWQSGPWVLRQERCYLLPGDSPLGFRLPLDSLPWTRKEDYPHVSEPDMNQPIPP